MDIRISDFYRPNERQALFHASGAKYRLFGGAAGPGKTTALLMEAVMQAHAWPGVHTLLLRRTMPELRDSLLAQFHQRIPKEMVANFTQSPIIEATWHNGSKTRFGYCNAEGDVEQYRGGEYVFVGFDELTHFTLSQWQFLTSRNRCPVPGSFPCMAGATNPGSRGHEWVKAYWIKHQAAPGEDRPDLYDSREYKFVNARLEHNPVYANDVAYKRTLERMPTPLRKALLEGNWEIFSGQYFENWRVDRHTVDPRQTAFPKLEYWHPRWISVDWGFAHSSAIYWHCQLGERIITYREHVTLTPDPHSPSGEKYPALGPRDLGELIADKSVRRNDKGEWEREKISHVFLSPDAFQKRTDAHTYAEQLGDALADHGLPRPAQADNDRPGGWMLMYEMLGADPPAWIVSTDCPVLIESLPLRIRDTEGDPEDVLKIDGDPGDDAADAARYGLKSYLRPRKPPLEVRINERITAETPHGRAMQAIKANIEERRKSAPHRMHRFGRFRGK